MDTENLLRRLRGVVGNAVVWGAGWAASAMVVFLGLKATGVVQSPSWLDGLMVAARFGFVGALAGTAFSAVIGLLYRGRRLAEISVVRFGMGGAVLGGVFVPAFLSIARLLSGDGPLPLENLLTNGLLSAAFGAVAAAGSLKLAQHARTMLPGGTLGRAGLLEGGDRLAWSPERDLGMHVAERLRTER
jgi:hypothetical protein